MRFCVSDYCVATLPIRRELEGNLICRIVSKWPVGIGNIDSVRAAVPTGCA